MAGGARKLELNLCSRKSGTAITSGVTAKLLILDLGCHCHWWDEFSTGTASLHIYIQFSVSDRRHPVDEAEVMCSPYRVGRRDT